MMPLPTPDPIGDPSGYQRYLLSLLGDDDPAEVQGATPAAWRSVVAQSGDLLAVRPEPDEWSVLECLAHAADAEIVYAGRYRWIVVHDEPPLGPSIGPVYPTSMTRHIWESLGHAARITLHVSVLRAARPGTRPDAHHVVEAQFKAFARALREAAAPDPRAGGVPSTKGVL